MFIMLLGCCGLRCKKENRNCLFHLATDDTKFNLYVISCADVGAFINFAEGETDNPISDWDALSLPEREAWMPDTDNIGTWIRERKDWAKNVVWCGWPQLCPETSRPILAPQWEPPRSKKNMPQESVNRLSRLLSAAHTEGIFQFQDVNLVHDLSRHVLDIYEFSPIQFGVQMNLAQIMHGLAGMARSVCGDGWTQDVVIQSWSAAERADYFSLFPQCWLVLTVLHDENHWALLATLVGHEATVVFDGSPRQGIQDAAETSVAFMATVLNTRLRLKHAEVPTQSDGWSCGHRCVVHAGYVLHVLNANGWSDLPKEAPKQVVSDTALHGVCQLGPEAKSSEFPPPDGLDDAKNEDTVLTKVLRKSCKTATSSDAKQTKTAKPKGSKGGKKGGEEPEKQPEKKRKRNEPSEDTAKKAKPAKQLGSKERTALAKEVESRLVEEHAFTHNSLSQFQREHRALKISQPRGHWHSFLLALHDGDALGCEACRKCRDLVGMGPNQSLEEVAQEAVVPFEDGDEELQYQVCEHQEDSLPKAVRARGRPRKDDEKTWPGLDKWLESTRPGVYQVIDKEAFKYLCRCCNQQLRFQRDADTFVINHEKRILHQTKLKLLQRHGQVDTVQQAEECVVAPCKGANLTTSHHLVPDLKKIETSIMAWISGGAPMIQGSTVSKAMFGLSGDGITFRHKDCSAEHVVGLCPSCFTLSRNTSLVADLKMWAWKLDLIQLAGYLVLGSSSDIQELAEAIPGRDYFEADIHKKQLEHLLKRNPVDSISTIRNSIISVSRNRRSPSLQALIDLRLSDVRQLLPCSMESDVFGTLMQKYQLAVQAGTCHRSEFEMASKIAPGHLRSEPVVEALFKSALSRLSKISNGSVQRTGTSEFFSSELAMDLLLVLGKSKESHKLLQSLILIRYFMYVYIIV